MKRITSLALFGVLGLVPIGYWGVSNITETLIGTASPSIIGSSAPSIATVSEPPHVMEESSPTTFTEVSDLLRTHEIRSLAQRAPASTEEVHTVPEPPRVVETPLRNESPRPQWRIDNPPPEDKYTLDEIVGAIGAINSMLIGWFMLLSGRKNKEPEVVAT